LVDEHDHELESVCSTSYGRVDAVLEEVDNDPLAIRLREDIPGSAEGDIAMYGMSG